MAEYPQAYCTSRLGTRPGGDIRHTGSLRQAQARQRADRLPGEGRPDRGPPEHFWPGPHGDDPSGILDGDHVVVVVDPRPVPGSIAVVLIGEEATVKHVYYERDALRLKSSNPAFSDLVYGPEDNPVVQGRVIGVVRRLPR